MGPAAADRSPLAVFGALLGQIASLASFRGGFEWGRILPLVVGGCLGVPLGVFFLHNADPRGFRLVVGVLLTGYCLSAAIGGPDRRRGRRASIN